MAIFMCTNAGSQRIIPILIDTNEDQTMTKQTNIAKSLSIVKSLSLEELIDMYNSLAPNAPLSVWKQRNRSKLVSCISAFLIIGLT